MRMINALKSVLNFFSLETNLNFLFLTIFAFSVLTFIVFLVLSIKVASFSKKCRGWLIVSHLTSLTVGICLSAFNIYSLLGYAFMFCFDLVSIAVLFSLPEKKMRVTNAQKEFVEFIDKEIKKEPEKPALKPILDKIIVNPTPLHEKTTEKPDIDFSHVGGILERLDYFPLSVSDKKQVTSLRANLLDAQNGKNDFDTKRRINDGLSDLLKIMSKYGV